MDPPSETGFLTEVYSSPIPQHTQNEQTGFDLKVDDFEEEPVKTKKSNKKSAKKSKKGFVEDGDAIELWSPAKRQSWEARKTNPNAFYYRHVDPGQVKRTGPWDESEKEAFMKAIKLHPPTQGKWGLFAMNIPGRVGYQCRNFYHKLLESGELREDSFPEEKKTEKAPRKQKTTKAKKAGKRKTKVFEESDDDNDEDIEIDDEIPQNEEQQEASDVEVSSPIPQTLEETGKQMEISVDEKVAKEPEFNINSLKLFSTKINDEDERIIKELDNSSEYLKEITSIEDYDAPASEVVEATAETLQRIVEPVQWTPRMKNPWETMKTSETISFPHDVDLDKKPEFEYQCSQIMKNNCDSPLNLILFSFPAPKEMKHAYLNALRRRLADNDGSQMSNALNAFFRAKNECRENPEMKEEICSIFVQSFINGEI